MYTLAVIITSETAMNQVSNIVIELKNFLKPVNDFYKNKRTYQTFSKPPEIFRNVLLFTLFKKCFFFILRKAVVPASLYLLKDTVKLCLFLYFLSIVFKVTHRPLVGNFHF